MLVGAIVKLLRLAVSNLCYNTVSTMGRHASSGLLAPKRRAIIYASFNLKGCKSIDQLNLLKQVNHKRTSPLPACLPTPHGQNFAIGSLAAHEHAALRAIAERTVGDGDGVAG